MGLMRAIALYNPHMNTDSRPGRSALKWKVQAAPRVAVGRVARVKSVEPVTSTSPPTAAVVTEWSRKGIMVRIRRYLTVGTIVQVHLEGEFSLWKVLCCIPAGNSFHVGLEFVEAVSP
jgi:hypothetical protein